jgi:putative transposase
MRKRHQLDKASMEEILQHYAAGIPASELCKRYGVPKSTLYTWLAKVTDTGSVKNDRLHALRIENKRLKLLLADGVLQLIFDRAAMPMDQDLAQKLQQVLARADEDVAQPVSKPPSRTARHTSSGTKKAGSNLLE